MVGCYGIESGSFSVSVTRDRIIKDISQSLNAGDYLSIPITVSNSNDISSNVFSISFSSADFELVSACEFSVVPILKKGLVSGTNVNITSVSTSGVSFVNNSSAPTMPGMVNIIKLKAKRTGILTVTCYAG